MNYASCLTHSIKCDVFDTFTKQRNSVLTKLVFDVYELQVEKNMFIEPIQALIKSQHYKEVSILFIYLRVYYFEQR